MRTCQAPDFIYRAANLEVFHNKQAKLGLKLLEGYSVVIFFADIGRYQILGSFKSVPVLFCRKIGGKITMEFLRKK